MMLGDPECVALIVNWRDGCKDRDNNHNIDNLSLLHLSQSPDGAPDACGGSGRVVPGSSSNGHTTVLVVAEPDTNSLSLHLVLSTEGAGIFAVLRDLHLLHSLPQASTVSGAVLSGDSDLLGSLGHRLEYFRLLL